MAMKKLKPVHREIVALHLQGLKNVDIADTFGITTVTVQNVLKDPLSVEIIDAAREENRMRLSALKAKAIDCMDEAMSSGSIDTKLKGASLYFREAARHSDDAGSETAEDVVQKIINMQVNGNLNISYEGSSHE